MSKKSKSEKAKTKTAPVAKTLPAVAVAGPVSETTEVENVGVKNLRHVQAMQMLKLLVEHVEDLKAEDVTGDQIRAWQHGVQGLIDALEGLEIEHHEVA